MRSQIFSESCFVAVAAILAIGCGCGSNEPIFESGLFAGTNVIFISVDTLRADRLGTYGYSRETSPNLDRIAEESVLFERAHAPRGLTWPSLVSMFTGLYPRTTNVRSNGDLLSDEIPTLLTILQDQGYQTAAFLANACRAFDRGVDHMLCKRKDREKEITRKAVEWINESVEAPFFLWIHLKAPHADYRPPEEYDVFTDANYSGVVDGSKDSIDRVILDESPTPEADRDHINGLYDGEVLFVDALIGKIWAALDARALLDSSIIVLTGDHGEELGQHNDYFYHSCSTLDSVLHVPLMIRFPGGELAGTRIPQIVENLDLTPTVLDLLGLEVDPSLEGKTMIPLLNAEPEGIAAFDHSIGEFYRSDTGWIRSIRTDRWRYLYNPEEIVPICRPEGKYFKVAREELYDHASDPLELNNLVDQYPEVAARLRTKLLSVMDSDTPTQAPMRAGPEVIEQLKELGYLED